MLQQTFVRLFDPRGRICRSEMLMIACGLLGLESVAILLSNFAADTGASLVFALKILIVLVGLSSTIKRLHDIGISGWWVLGGLALLCMWTAIIAVGGLFVVGRDVLSPGSTGHLAILGLVMLPPTAMTLWLHLAEGESYKNVYGAPGKAIFDMKPAAAQNTDVQNDQHKHQGSGIAA